MSLGQSTGETWDLVGIESFYRQKPFLWVGKESSTKYVTLLQPDF